MHASSTGLEERVDGTRDEGEVVLVDEECKESWDMERESELYRLFLVAPVPVEEEELVREWEVNRPGARNCA